MRLFNHILSLPLYGNLMAFSGYAVPAAKKQSIPVTGVDSLVLPLINPRANRQRIAYNYFRNGIKLHTQRYRLTIYLNAVDGKSFYEVLNGSNVKTNKEEIFIHYSSLWGRFKHDRWVMNENYKLYRDGRFYNTSKDPLEEYPLSNYSKEEEQILKELIALLQEKEEEIRFERNDTNYKVDQKQ